ncbi:hypothetical protein JOF53_002910 [Crossiella equi]|uniref:YtxH domain-containing protein n=1 Tax=Crossiella equi TaxID=130796 RepID=A0ABS5ABR6_9PSEU|nr:hypothetical protein [Crossiella equi]MBP2474038.1 hypothetical protein [Crossiella equi]
MIRFALGVAVGYVLGSRAGRERYEDLVRMYHRMVEHPAVQGTAGAVRAKVDEKLPWGKDKGEGAGQPPLAKGQQGDKLASEAGVTPPPVPEQASPKSSAPKTHAARP